MTVPRLPGSREIKDKLDRAIKGLRDGSLSPEEVEKELEDAERLLATVRREMLAGFALRERVGVRQHAADLERAIQGLTNGTLSRAEAYEITQDAMATTALIQEYRVALNVCEACDPTP